MARENVKEMIERLRERDKKRMRAMVNRFLCMKMPKDFGPDGYIKFDREAVSKQPEYSWPTGTNLLHAEQAEAMFRHCIPPECYGDDDCSSAILANCPFAETCGK